MDFSNSMDIDFALSNDITPCRTTVVASFDAICAEINFRRSREVNRWCQETERLAEGGQYVLVSSVTFWSDLFVRHFVYSDEQSRDDLLFFVRKRPLKGTRIIPRYEVWPRAIS